MLSGLGLSWDIGRMYLPDRNEVVYAFEYTVLRDSIPYSLP